MSLPTRLLPEAQAELSDAFDWLEQWRPGEGARLVRAVRATIRAVAANPRMHGVVFKDVRKALVTGFRYLVLYREEAGELVMVSVFHTSRDPADWQSRV